MARFHWVPLGIASVCLFSTPAEAAKLLSWRFESSQNQLSFTTNAGVQPKAKLIANPTRLVIDLPKTSLDSPTREENLGGTVKSLRVGQFDAQTTRIVVEIAGGYTINPEEIKIRGATPTEWTVKIPQPTEGSLLLANGEKNNPRTGDRRRISQERQQSEPEQRSEERPEERSEEQKPEEQGGVARENAGSSVNVDQQEGEGALDLQMTNNGLFVRVNGEEDKKIEVKRSRDGRLIEFELEGVTLPPSLQDQKLSVNNYGVSEIEFSQTKKTKAKISLRVNKDSPDWQASFSRQGGLVLWPVGGISAVDTGNSSPLRVRSETEENKQATIQGVRLGENNAQLLIEADQKVEATGSWNASKGVYEIKIADAKLAANFQNPDFGANSPIYQLNIEQADPKTVMVTVHPALGVRIDQLNQPSDQLLALNFRGFNTVAQSGNPNQSNTTRPVSPPPRPLPPTRVEPPNPISRNPNQRIVVMIDPGHGGKDPGAVGIGGMQEKHIILPMSQQIAHILEKNGIQVILTRSSDYFVTLQGRADMANRANADIFVSIHANSMGMNRPDVNGLETYYYETGKQLADTIHKNVLREVDVDDRRVRRARFFVLRKTAMPAVLVEVGFLTGNEDAAKLANPAYRQEMAEAIANGILQYVRQNKL